MAKKVSENEVADDKMPAIDETTVIIAEEPATEIQDELLGEAFDDMDDLSLDEINALNDDIADMVNDIDDVSVRYYPLWQKLVAEFVGTAIFLFIVYMNAVYSKLTFNDSAPLQTVLTIFFAYAAVKVAFGGVSGGHFNPAISIAAAVAKKITTLEGVLYCAAQIVAGLFSTLLLLAILPQPVTEIPALTTKVYLQFAANGYGTAGPSAIFDSVAGSQSASLATLLSYSPISLAVVEFVATLLLVLASLAVAKSFTNNALKALGAGVAYAAATYITISITSAGLNPARSIVIALFANNGSVGDVSGSNIAQLWLYVLIPVCAGLVAGLVYSVIDYLKDGPFSSVDDDINLDQDSIPLFAGAELNDVLLDAETEGLTVYSEGETIITDEFVKPTTEADYLPADDDSADKIKDADDKKSVKE